jgi:hypothetical protein
VGHCARSMTETLGVAEQGAPRSDAARGWNFRASPPVIPTSTGTDERWRGSMDSERCIARRLQVRLLAIATATLLPVIALGQGADELASTIEQSLEGIEFRLDIRPQKAADDLQAQGRQLELLEKQAPQHPALPELKQKFSELQDGLASALATAAGGAGKGEGAAQVPTAPAAFTSGMEEVDALHRQAEAEFLRGETDAAADYLQQAEAHMTDLERRYGDELPPGNVPLLVAKEKIAALKDQLAEAKSQD